jgi:hypothetical protein
VNDRALLWLYVALIVVFIYAALEDAIAARKSQQLADLSISLVQLEHRQRQEAGEHLFDKMRKPVKEEPND